MIVYIITFFLFLIFLAMYSRISRESFDMPTILVLVGDSVLNNAHYAKSTVVDNLPTSTILLATDNARISNVYQQIETAKNAAIIPNGAQFVLSVGGNNLLDDPKSLDATFDAFIKCVDSISSVSTHKLLVCDLYYPPNKKSLTNIIAEWNIRLGRMKNIHIVPLSLVMTEPADFVSEIEPSDAGSRKIAGAILAAMSTG